MFLLKYQGTFAEVSKSKHLLGESDSSLLPKLREGKGREARKHSIYLEPKDESHPKHEKLFLFGCAEMIGVSGLHFAPQVTTDFGLTKHPFLSGGILLQSLERHSWAGGTAFPRCRIIEKRVFCGLW